MARDGMIPELFHKVNPRTLTPVPARSSWRSSSRSSPGLIPIEFLAEMTSIGTLVAFLVVSLGVIILRRTSPDLPRGFKVPRYPVMPILSIAGCIWIITPPGGDDLRLPHLGRRGDGLVLLLRRHSTSAVPGRGGARDDPVPAALPTGGEGSRCSWRSCWLARPATTSLCARWCPSPGPRAWRAWTPSTARSCATAAGRWTWRASWRRLAVPVPLVVSARSVPAGLVEAAEDHSATAIAGSPRRVASVGSRSAASGAG